MPDTEAPNTNDPASGSDGKAAGEAEARETAPGGAPQDRAPDGLPQDPEALRRKLEVVSAQLEESFARAREGQTKLKEEHERLLRTAAEFENYKRRAVKEKEDTRKYGVEALLKDFLPVADNLERALEHAGQHDPRQVIDGVKLVQKMLDAALGKHGVVGFSSVGQPFDPAQHEALMQAESDSAPGTVVQEMARGYRLHDRLVRPAAVVVAKPRAAGSGSPEPSPAAGSPGDVSKN